MTHVIVPRFVPANQYMFPTIPSFTFPFPTIFLRFLRSYGPLLYFYIFCRFFLQFRWFSTHFPHFRRYFLCFSGFFGVFPAIFLQFSYDLPTVFLRSYGPLLYFYIFCRFFLQFRWFSTHFPHFRRYFLCFSGFFGVFPAIFLQFSYDLPTAFLRFLQSNYLIPDYL